MLFSVARVCVCVCGQAGKFAEAQEHLDWLMSAIPLVVVSSRTEANEVKELLGICTEYKVGVYIELSRKALPAEDQKRQVCVSALRTGFPLLARND